MRKREPPKTPLVLGSGTVDCEAGTEEYSTKDVSNPKPGVLIVNAEIGELLMNPIKLLAVESSENAVNSPSDNVIVPMAVTLIGLSR